MQNRGNFSNVAFCPMRDLSKVKGAWPKWPNGKYASDLVSVKV